MALTQKEKEDFDAVYYQLVDDVVNDKKIKDISQSLTWLEKVLNYNVPQGKRIRGYMVPITLKCIVENPTKELMHQANILGWCIEILQASFLVADDIMDNSETRRGQPCWYKVDAMGSIAFNDSLMLEHAVYRILVKYFHDKSYYTDLVDLFLDVTHKTILGQSLDTQTGKDRDMADYTLERFTTIVKYKTSYYTIYLPVALIMAMQEMKDPVLWEKMEKIALDIGHMFQIQDDYLDCFGDENTTGKVGTDIQDCKCSWPFVTAKDKCTPEQLSLLMDNYGYDDKEKVALVKKLYTDLGIVGEYNRYEEESYTNIVEAVKEIGNQLPETVFRSLLGMIYKRNK